MSAAMMTTLEHLQNAPQAPAKTAKGKQMLRAPSSYALFVEAETARMKQSDENVVPKARMTLIGEKWKALSDSERQIYTDRVNAEKQRIAGLSDEENHAEWLKTAAGKRAITAEKKQAKKRAQEAPWEPPKI